MAILMMASGCLTFADISHDIATGGSTGPAYLPDYGDVRTSIPNLTWIHVAVPVSSPEPDLHLRIRWVYESPRETPLFSVFFMGFADGVNAAGMKLEFVSGFGVKSASNQTYVYAKLAGHEPGFGGPTTPVLAVPAADGSAGEMGLDGVPLDREALVRDYGFEDPVFHFFYARAMGQPFEPPTIELSWSGGILNYTYGTHDLGVFSFLKKDFSSSAQVGASLPVVAPGAGMSMQLLKEQPRDSWTVAAFHPGAGAGAGPSVVGPPKPFLVRPDAQRVVLDHGDDAAVEFSGIPGPWDFVIPISASLTQESVPSVFGVDFQPATLPPSA